jgi:hypothetical protein
MATLLMNLRNVPDDEAAEIRALLEANRIEFYETPVNRWGISAGGIWLVDGDSLEEARRLLADYQDERQRRARSQPKPPLQPVKLLIYLAFIGLLLYLSIKPFVSFGE